MPMVLVTGGAGYVGSHAVQALLDRGEQVVVLDDLSTGHRELLPECPFVEGSIADGPLVRRLLAEHPIEAVMHFAASSVAAESVSDPTKYWRNNVGGTATLLGEMARSSVRTIVFSSSASVYGDPAAGPIPEDAPLLPVTPYGATKAAMERMLQDCEAAFGLRWVALRYFNAAGADPEGRRGEWHEPETHLIPLALEVAAGSRDELVIYGDDYPTDDGTCIRDYVHVLDLAEAHVRSLEHLRGGGPSRIYNVGSGRGASVLEVVRAVERVTGAEVRTRRAPRRAGDPAALVADVTRIREELGWEARWSEIGGMVGSAWGRISR